MGRHYTGPVLHHRDPAADTADSFCSWTPAAPEFRNNEISGSYDRSVSSGTLVSKNGRRPQTFGRHSLRIPIGVMDAAPAVPPAAPPAATFRDGLGERRQIADKT